MADSELLKIQAEVRLAKRRLKQFQAKESLIIVKAVDCKMAGGCGVERGYPCKKPSGVRTAPHAQRRRAAEELIVKGL